MKSLVEHLSTYAHYHRDQRNITTHFVGIPMIVFAVSALLSRPVLFDLAGLPITPSVLATLASIIFYYKLHRLLGLIMALLLAVCLCVAINLAQMSTAVWLGASISIFVIGWIFQFVGHYFEGKKPAFVDDIVGLVIGPLFILTELLFRFGQLQDIQQQIERRAGKVRKGARPLDRL